VFRALWQRIARLFGGGKDEGQYRAPGGIPAPETLVAKVKNVQNKDRDILRVAGEAMRRGHPDQAVIAYWKAVQVYLRDGQLLKAISTLKMILQQSPEDLDAFHALADAYEALDRKRDAANTCLWIADIFARRGQHAEALAVLNRSMELDPFVKGARERIQALGGELPQSARPASDLKLRMKSTAAPPPQPPQHNPIAEQILNPVTPSEDDNPEMPGESAMLDDDKLELDIEGDDAMDFPDDSLVLPITEARPSPSLDMAATETDPGFEDESATVAMAAIDKEVEEGLKSGGDDGTILSMEPPPWDGPTDAGMGGATDETAAQDFEDVTDPPTPMPARKFAIQQASTTVDIKPPSAMEGSEHDPEEKPPEPPKVGIPNAPTRAYSIQELKNLGLKPKPPEE
jgi:tetratricopeptide (TPR) repeat protein